MHRILYLMLFQGILKVMAARRSQMTFGPLYLA